MDFMMQWCVLVLEKGTRGRGDVETVSGAQHESDEHLL